MSKPPLNFNIEADIVLQEAGFADAAGTPRARDTKAMKRDETRTMVDSCLAELKRATPEHAPFGARIFESSSAPLCKPI